MPVSCWQKCIKEVEIKNIAETLVPEEDISRMIDELHIITLSSITIFCVTNLMSSITYPLNDPELDSNQKMFLIFHPLKNPSFWSIHHSFLSPIPQITKSHFKCSTILVSFIYEDNPDLVSLINGGATSVSICQVTRQQVKNLHFFWDTAHMSIDKL